MVTNALKQFASKLRLSVFDHFVGLALKGLINASRMTQKRTMTVFPTNCGLIKEHGFPENLKPIILHALHRRTRLNTHEVKEVRDHCLIRQRTNFCCKIASIFFCTIKYFFLKYSDINY